MTHYSYGLGSDAYNLLVRIAAETQIDLEKFQGEGRKVLLELADLCHDAHRNHTEVVTFTDDHLRTLLAACNRFGIGAFFHLADAAHEQNIKLAEVSRVAWEELISSAARCYSARLNQEGVGVGEANGALKTLLSKYRP